jgi:hypothetical protein
MSFQCKKFASAIMATFFEVADVLCFRIGIFEDKKYFFLQFYWFCFMTTIQINIL